MNNLKYLAVSQPFAIDWNFKGNSKLLLNLNWYIFVVVVAAATISLTLVSLFLLASALFGSGLGLGQCADSTIHYYSPHFLTTPLPLTLVHVGVKFDDFNPRPLRYVTQGEGKEKPWSLRERRPKHMIHGWPRCWWTAERASRDCWLGWWGSRRTRGGGNIRKTEQWTKPISLPLVAARRRNRPYA